MTREHRVSNTMQSTSGTKHPLASHNRSRNAVGEELRWSWSCDHQHRDALGSRRVRLRFIASGIRALASYMDRSEERRRDQEQRRLVSFFTQDERCLAREVRIASTVISRFVGLLDRAGLATDEGLLLAPGGTVHTFGMRFPIDLVFLDAELRVNAFCRRVQPWRICLAPPRTSFVLELPAGRIDAIKLHAEDRLALRSAVRGH